MRWGNELNAGGVLFDKGEYISLKLGCADNISAFSAADRAILAINASEIAPGEKYRSRTSMADKAGLFPLMEHYF